MFICGLISRTVVAWTFLIVAVAPGVSFATSGLLNPQHHPLQRSVRSGIGDYTLSDDEARIITYLRRNAAGSQLLAADYMQGLAFAIYGGLPQYFCSPEERPFIPEAECERRSRVMIDLTSGLSTLAEDGVRWLVLPTEMAGNLGSAYPANVVECLKTPGFVLLRISDGGSDIGCGRARLSSEMWSGP